MIRTLRLRYAVLLPAILLGFSTLPGCGGAGRSASIKGTLVLPANAPLGANDSGVINFVPADGSKQGVGGGNLNVADKSFTIHAADGGGLAPGKYNVKVTLTAYTGSEGAQQRQAAFDELNKTYASGDKLSYEVTSAPNQEIVIDLAAGTITKK